MHEYESGEVEITYSDKTIKFKPNFEFLKAVEIFEQYSARFGKNYYDEETDIDWFPAIQYFLFHKFLFPSLLYADAIKYITENKLRPKFTGGTRLLTLYRIIQKRSFVSRLALQILWRVELILTYIHNRWICKFYGDMFFQYSDKEMRLQKLQDKMASYRTGVIAIGGGLKVLKKHFFNRRFLIVIPVRYHPLNNVSNEDILNSLAICTIAESRRQFNSYQNLFRKRPAGKNFYGIDDPLYLFPLLFSLNRNNVSTIGFQHGLYSNNDFGYAVRNCVKFEWFNRLVVWDEFWANVYNRINPYYNGNSIFSGMGVEQFDLNFSPNPDNKRVLCMYERFLNIEEYVFYLKSLINAGFFLVIKMRPESSVTDIATEYGFSEQEMKSISVCDKITDDLIAQISLIAGCKTSLLYSLLNSGRPVWIFRTTYHYLEQLKGLDTISYIDRKDIPNLSDIYNESIKAVQQVQSAKQDYSSDLDMVLKRVTSVS